MDNPTFGGGGLTPQQMQAYLEFVSGQGSFDEQEKAIQKQIEMANALRNRPMDQYRTGKGAALGGLGNVLNQYMGSRDVAQAQREDKLAQLARVAALRKMANAYNPQPDPGMMGAQMAPGGGAYTMPGQ